MNRLYAASAAIFFLIAAYSPVSAETAGEVSGWCKPLNDAVQMNNGTLSVTGGNANSSFCWGAFEVIQELSRWVQADGKTRVVGVCSPPESDRLEMVHIFLHYMIEHPEKEHLEFPDVAIASLKTAFPCK